MIVNQEFDFGPIKFLKLQEGYRILSCFRHTHMVLLGVGFPLLGTQPFRSSFFEIFPRSHQLLGRKKCGHFALTIKWLLA